MLDEKQLLELVANGTPLRHTLEALCREIEKRWNGMLCSVLLLDPDGLHLRHGAAPSLPEDYIRAVDGMAIGPSAASCGTAAYRQSLVIVSDIARDPLWVDYRDVASRHGLGSCWSTPIFSSEAKVLGTFAVYCPTPRTPSAEDIEVTKRASHIATIAIERKRWDEERERISQEMLAYRDRSRALSVANLKAREDEARRIARDLHDSAGQLLVTIHVSLQELMLDLPPAYHARFPDVEKVLKQVEDHLRRMSHELRPTILDDLGLKPALEFLARGVSARTGIRITVDSSTEERLPPVVETALYRIAQEALTNVAKHAKATSVRIELERGGQGFRCVIRDDGCGFDVSGVLAPHGQRGLGILGIQERLEALGGMLEIISAPGAGTELRITIPQETHDVAPVGRG